MRQMESFEFPLTRQWVHSFEEDSGDLTTYRPADYQFPPARGRAGIEFHADGTFTERQIGPADALVEVRGRWQYGGSGLVRVSFDDPGRPERMFEIVECTDQKLQVRRRS